MANASKKVRAGEDHDESFEAFYPGVSQVKAFTAVTGQSSAITAGVSLVRLVSTQNCHIKTGSNPTAVADGTCMYLPLGVPVLIGVSSGDKIAVIRDSADGNLFITEAAT